MSRYIIRRLLILPITLFGLSMLVFGMLQTLDPIQRLALFVNVAGKPMSPETLQNLIRLHGLDRPVYEQYFTWLGNVMRFNFGWSRSAQQPVSDAIAQYFPATLELVLWSFFPIMLGGIFLGIKAAVNHNKPIDQAARLFSIVGYAFPSFVFGLLMLLLFYAALGWLAPGRLSNWATDVVNSRGFTTYTNMYTIDALLNLRFDVFLDALKHLILPMLTLAYVNWALVLRVMRSSMLEVLRAEYTTVARAKGLSERDVINRHARPNAMIPVATIGGLLFAGLLNGSVLTETVYDFHGMGWWAGKAALSFDATAVLSITLLSGVVLILANLGVDLLYAYLDPRIRLD
jgi:peptide/nickel transport system permease protein